LSLGIESDAEAERVFSALSDGGEVFVPMCRKPPSPRGAASSGIALASTG
jgi:hypothetical protein